MLWPTAFFFFWPLLQKFFLPDSEIGYFLLNGSHFRFDNKFFFLTSRCAKNSQVFTTTDSTIGAKKGDGLSGPIIAEKMVAIIQVNRNQTSRTFLGTNFLLNTSAIEKKQTNTNGKVPTNNNRSNPNTFIFSSPEIQRILTIKTSHLFSFA